MPAAAHSYVDVNVKVRQDQPGVWQAAGAPLARSNGERVVYDDRKLHTSFAVYRPL
jgi:hypothetical protein